MPAAIQVSDEILTAVDPVWRNEFRQFVATGEASEGFKNYLDNSPECQQAIDRALTARFAEIKALVPDGPPTSPGPGMRGWRPVAITAGVLSAFFVGCVLTFGLHMKSREEALQTENQALRADLHWANRPDKHPVELLAQIQDDLPRIAEWLNSRDPKVREHAANVLLGLPGVLETGAPMLAGLDKGKGERLYQDILKVAASTPPTEDSSEGLLHALQSQQALQLQQAFQLAKLSSDLNNLLPESSTKPVKDITSPDRTTRLSAYEALRKKGPAAQAAVPSLLKKLDAEKMDGDERKKLLDALTYISPATAIREKNKASAEAIVDSMRVAIWQGELKSNDVASRIRAAKELAQLGPRAKASSKDLFKAYQGEKDIWARWEMATALLQIDPSAAEKAGLEAPGPLSIAFAPAPTARGIFLRDQQREVAGLALGGLEATNPKVREKSAEALAQLGPAASPILRRVVEAYRVEKEPSVQEKLADTVKKLEVRRASKYAE
jgi:hypothetical protein